MDLNSDFKNFTNISSASCVPISLEGGIEIAFSMHEMAFFSSASSSAFFRRLQRAGVGFTAISTSVSVVFSATP